MGARRLPAAGADAASGRRVRFRFDGRSYEGIEGEPLAVALLAADRPILSRSFRFHRPRGLMCSTGQCGWCECEVDGRPSVRSCRVPVRAGLVARGEHGLPSVERDLLSLTGAFSRWIPPTFYHHRFLRPRSLRKMYLDVLRWFGGRGRLVMDGRRVVASAASGARIARRIEPDVLVVGGGRAGLLTALGAAEAGAHTVLIESDAELGSWRIDLGAVRGIGSIEDLARDAAAAGVEILTGVSAVGWYDGMVAALGDAARYDIRPRVTIAATGSHDRVPLVPGADRPGVMSARTIAWLVDRCEVLPGDRVLLVGEGQELVAAGELISRAGAGVVHGPIRTGSLIAVRGRRRVTGAITSDAGRRRRLAFDLIVFGDRSPSLDLALAAGARVERRGDTLVPVADAAGRTSVPSLFVVGSAAGRPILGPADAGVARQAGRVAAGARGPSAAAPAIHAQAPSQTIPTAPEVGHTDGVTTPDPGAIVCFCEDVRVWEVTVEQATGYRDPELIKRRTGALTGPCQGKSCLQAFACLAGDGATGPADTITLPTSRPPLRPVRLADLVGPPSDTGSPGAHDR